MHSFLRFICPLLLVATALAGEPQKILMIGNSLTYTWDIPQVLERLASASGHKLTVSRNVNGGKDLAYHWANPMKLTHRTAKDEIATGGYDLVIMQEYSNMLQKPEGRESFATMAPQYHQAIAAAGMRAMLYMAHPTSKAINVQALQPVIDQNTAMADKLGIPCAPAALAFVKADEKLPKLALFDCQSDRTYAQGKVATHQSPFGSYLAACTIYAAIYNQSPVGNTFHAVFDAKKEFPIDPADAKAAQEIAWQVWQEYAAKRPAAAGQAKPVKARR